jgi:hypothetical protein
MGIWQTTTNIISHHQTNHFVRVGRVGWIVRAFVRESENSASFGGSIEGPYGSCWAFGPDGLKQTSTGKKDPGMMPMAMIEFVSLAKEKARTINVERRNS